MVSTLVLTLSLWAAEPSEAADVSVPAGVWSGVYQTRQAVQGRLRLEVSFPDGQPSLTVYSWNEHYPEVAEETLDAFVIDGPRIQWTLHFGPNPVTFSGTLKGAFLVGELEGGQGRHRFVGFWSAVHDATRVRPAPQGDSK